METLRVTIPPSPSRSYPLYIGENIFADAVQELALGRYSRVAVVTDVHVQPLWSARLREVLPGDPLEIVIATGEDNKTIESVSQVWRALMAAGFDRHAIVFNLGGGLTGDLGGFAASTYMRGIDFVQVPTSLLAQVDASVGGKVGVNFGEVKNLAGTFQQPKAVILDVATLTTLPARELRAGFAEVIKHAAIRDRRHFEDLMAHHYVTASPSEWAALVRTQCHIKANVVTADERERGLRKILNFGHTMGHALEMESYAHGAPLLHGEAVALGMRFAATLSARLGHLPQQDAERLSALLEQYELPTRVPFPAAPDDLLRRILSDKKNEAGTVKWTLLTGLGSAIFDVHIDEPLLREALEEIL